MTIQQACTRKRWFETKRVAREAARRWRGRGTVGALKPYRCPCCQGWHLTSRKPAAPARQEVLPW